MNAEIGCAGILVEDTFCGPMRALPPEGALLALDGMPVKAGGCAANVAIDLVKQGLAVDVAGCLGRDPAADTLRTKLTEQGVGCTQISVTDQFPTSRTVILLVEGQDRRYLHVFGANRAFTVAHLNRDWLARLKIFYFGGLFAMPGIDLSALREALIFCRAKGIITIVDVVMSHNWQDDGQLAALLPHIDYFLPNNDEARLITGQSDPLAQLRWFQAAGARTVVITQGKAGSLAGRDGRYWRCGIFPAQVVDPSGSGDAFGAGIIAAIHRGGDLPDLLRYGSALGASATRAVGTTDGVFTAAEATAFLAANSLPVETGQL